jgi:hypothetical protein
MSLKQPVQGLQYFARSISCNTNYTIERARSLGQRRPSLSVGIQRGEDDTGE